MDDVLGGFSPFGVVGEAAGRAAAEGWTGIMLSFWSAGTWVLKWALVAMDTLLTPDVRASGPAGEVYRTTFWIGGALVLVMMCVQLMVALFRRRGEDLGRVAIGVAQFGLVYACGIVYAGTLLAACGGLTHALLDALFDVDSLSSLDLTGDIDIGRSAIELPLVTTLGILGIFMWIAAIGHFVVMLGRNAALVILVAVAPIAAAGLVSDAGRSWFWKTVRWFHAAALTPVLTVLVLGIGTKLASAVGEGKSGSVTSAVGLAITSVVIVLISLVAPLALFRLLAFVDPGTTSGASARAGLAAAGGVSGLMGGGGDQGSGSQSSLASTPGASGQSQGEGQQEEATTRRFAGALANIGGPIGQSVSRGMDAIAGAGAKLASVSADSMNQGGVGDSSYYPELERTSRSFNPARLSDGDGSGGPSAGPSTSLPGAGGPGGATGSAGKAASVAAEIPPIV